MHHHGDEDHSFVDENMNGEIEIEKIASNEVEIRRRELLPVLDHFRRIQPDWKNDR